ncbi:DeoR family transcriptional regulator [Mesorhizobium intechi]|uniref:DeoR family transcriptional regulator n=1 Tax=Mesorhizobium intechi TaxID=537601 RepID=UPI000CC59CA8|nr:DeoR family transcriptional regulator [Mesorhizobium intechi]TSE12198.1 DeoR family transcriptional regulator [Mesorhizobium intechi]
MDQSRLSKKERHELILSEVRRSASIRVSRLALRLGVAGETIRRDLIELGATNDKFDRNSLERICTLGALSDIVTDREPQPALRAVIEAAGTELHVCSGD